MHGPEKIARYEIQGELGRGGMGVVYRAWDPQLHRAVALKVILFPEAGDDDLREQLEIRFEREARAAAGIVHPNVVTVFDFGRDGDYLYLVMELVEGRSLRDRLSQGGRLSVDRALQITVAVAEALECAHKARVVHRDVTPRNILLGVDGRVAVTDFGVARSLGDASTRITHSGMLVGSPAYMAPELIQNLEVDGRADLFSTGLVLYRMVAGQSLFKGSDISSLLYRIVHEDALASPEAREGIDRGLLEILERCLAKEPSERFANARELGQAARRLLERVEEDSELVATLPLGVPVAPNPASSGSAPRRWRAIVLGAAVTVVLALGGFQLMRWTGEAATVQEAVSSEIPALEDNSGVDGEDRVVEERSAETLNEVDASPDPEALGAEPVPGESTPVPGEARSTVPARLEDSTPSPRIPDQPEEVTEGGDPPGEPLEERDHVAPILSVDAMPREVTGSEVVLAGRVMDDRGVVELQLDSVPVDVGEAGEFEVRRTLQAGRNQLVFVATDPAGNSTVKTLEVEPALPEPAGADLVLEDSGTESAASPQSNLEPPREGQEASRRFLRRGDGTVSDLVTGNTWTDSSTSRAVSWKKARQYCRKLEVGPAKDWQLPTVQELEELHLALSRVNLAAGRAVPSFVSAAIWSSSKGDGGRMWTFDFSEALAVEQAITSAAGRALCVRRSATGLPPGPGGQFPGGDPAGDRPRDARRPPPPRGGGGG